MNRFYPWWSTGVGARKSFSAAHVVPATTERAVPNAIVSFEIGTPSAHGVELTPPLTVQRDRDSERWATIATTVAHRLRWMLLLVVGGLLVALALGQVERAIGAVIQRDEVMYGEAIIYDHAARILRGAPLYQSLTQAPYTVVAYTPMYYWIAAQLLSLFGPAFGPGRVVSVAAALVAGGLVGYLAAGRRSPVWAGLFAAALFLALGFPNEGPGFDYPWFGFYKEDMLGVTLSLGAIAALSDGVSRRRVVVSAVLAALAVLTKQTLVAAGVAGFVWLLVRDRRQAALFAGISGGLLLITSLVMELTTHAYLANILAISGRTDPFNDYVLHMNLGVLLQFQAAPLGITAVCLIVRLRRWRGFLDDPVVPYALASLVPLVGLAKIGSNYNYWIDLAAITAVFVTRGIWGGLNRDGPLPRAGKLARAAAATIPIIFLAVLGAHLAMFLRDVHPSMNLLAIVPSEQQRDLRNPDGGFDWVVSRVRTEPKEVLSENVDVVVLAGRPMLVEPILFTIMVKNKQWDDGPLAQRICAGDIGLVVLKGPLRGGTESDQYLRTALWPPQVLEAMRETMQLESMKAAMFVYSPSRTPVEFAAPTSPTTTVVCNSLFS